MLSADSKTISHIPQTRPHYIRFLVCCQADKGHFTQYMRTLSLLPHILKVRANRSFAGAPKDFENARNTEDKNIMCDCFERENHGCGCNCGNDYESNGCSCGCENYESNGCGCGCARQENGGSEGGYDCGCSHKCCRRKCCGICGCFSRLFR